MNLVLLSCCFLIIDRQIDIVYPHTHSDTLTLHLTHTALLKERQHFNKPLLFSGKLKRASLVRLLLPV